MKDRHSSNPFRSAKYWANAAGANILAEYAALEKRAVLKRRTKEKTPGRSPA
jgi:hypothetical protein